MHRSLDILEELMLAYKQSSGPYGEERMSLDNHSENFENLKIYVLLLQLLTQMADMDICLQKT